MSAAEGAAPAAEVVPTTTPTKPEPAPHPNKREALRRVVALARPEWPRLFWATLALLGSTGLTLIYPQLVRMVIDGVQAGGDAAAVNRYALGLLGLFAAASVLGGLRSYLFTVAGERIVTDLRRRLYQRLIHQDIAFFDQHRTGELTNRLAADTAVVQNAATVNLSMLLRYAISSLGSLIILAATSWRLTLVMLALVPVAVVGGLFFGRWVRTLSRSVQDALASSTAIAEETLGGVRTVRAHAREGAEDARYAAAVEVAFDLGKQRARIGALFSGVAQFAGLGAISGVLWYGALQLMDGEITIGALTQFLLYTFTMAIGIGTLGSLYQDFMRAIGASERVFELVETPPGMVSGTERLDAVRGAVAFEDVGFSYPTRPDQRVVDAVTLQVNPGERVALVGPSGGGKSTLRALLLRLYDPQAGRITIDDHDLRQLDVDWLRRQVGTVAQEPLLFATSVLENVRYARPEASEVEVEAALAAAHALDFVRALPEGLRTQVGERGVQLSGGQKQRVAIARALLADPPILVLDEATSALDAESEHLVAQALERLMRGRTTLIIAHRLSTVQTADRIVVIDRGRVVEQGRHGELMGAKGAYWQLVQRQTLAHSEP